VEHERHRVSLNQLIQDAKKRWHGVKCGHPDWASHSRSLAFEFEVRQQGLHGYIIMNAHWEPLDFQLPPSNVSWRRWLDTSLTSPLDIVPWQTAVALPDHLYRAAARSVVVLFEEAPL
jgi:glycogen operon protein